MRQAKYFAMVILFTISAAGIIAACSPQTACSKEGKSCEDGTIVGRTGPNCEFEKCPNEGKISNFEECAAAGNPVMESYPRRCRADGNTFVENISDDYKEDIAKNSKIIKTSAGELTLKYKNNQAVLSGELFRSTPCVSWKLVIITTKDLPISEVNIAIYDENKRNENEEMVCIQVVGEPQQINEITQASEKTNYKITFEDEIIFEGKLGNGVMAPAPKPIEDPAPELQ